MRVGGYSGAGLCSQPDGIHIPALTLPALSVLSFLICKKGVRTE